MASIYLLHFNEPFRHARHYLGLAPNSLAYRLRQHSKGTGAVLMRHVKAAGITWMVAREWDIPTGYTPREYEKKLKRRHSGVRLCPICKARKRHE